MTDVELKAHIQTKVDDELRKHAKPLGFNIGRKSVKGYDMDTPQGRGLAFARTLRALAISKNNFKDAEGLVKSWQNEQRFESDDNIIKLLQKNALNPDSLAEGGIFVTPERYKEFIEILYAKAVVRKLPGIRFQTFTSGTLEIDKETGSGNTAEWVGSAVPSANATEATFGIIKMEAKTLNAVATIKNSLLRRADSGTNIDQMVMDILVRSASIAVDQAFIRSLGSAYTPKGLLGWIKSSQQIAMNGTKSTATIKAELTKMISDVEGSDVNIDSGAWIMNSRQKAFIGNVSSTNDISIFPEINSDNPMLKGFPVFTTSNVPNTLGGGTESEIYFVNGSNIVIADALDMNINIITEGNYRRGGTEYSTSVRKETAFDLTTETDFALTQDAAGSVLTGVTYI